MRSRPLYLLMPIVSSPLCVPFIRHPAFHFPVCLYLISITSVWLGWADVEESLAERACWRGSVNCVAARGIGRVSVCKCSRSKLLRTDFPPKAQCRAIALVFGATQRGCLGRAGMAKSVRNKGSQ